MPAHNRRLKVIEFDLDGANHECQIKSWKILNRTPDPAKGYTFCPDGEYADIGDDDYALELTFLADWRLTGISEVLWSADGETVPWTLDHHPGVVGEHQRFTGTCLIRRPDVGGERGETEMTQITLMCFGTPQKVRL
ncbi:MAG: hypothetical protein ACRCZP_16790 [Phycicoccus sp.]